MTNPLVVSFVESMRTLRLCGKDCLEKLTRVLDFDIRISDFQFKAQTAN